VARDEVLLSFFYSYSVLSTWPNDGDIFSLATMATRSEEEKQSYASSWTAMSPRREHRHQAWPADTTISRRPVRENAAKDFDPKMHTAILFFPTWLAATVLAGGGSQVSSRELYDQVMADLFRRPEESTDFVSANAPVVTIRINGELDPETQVTLHREGGVTVAAIIRSMDRPIHEQIFALRSKNPKAGFEAVRDSLEIEHETVSSRECPRLSRLFAEFADIRLSPMVDSSLYAPSATYQIWVTEPLEHRYFQVMGPSRQSDGVAFWGSLQSHSAELIEWIHQLLSLLAKPRPAKACADRVDANIDQE